MQRGAVIVGGGEAGVQCAASLRANGWQDAITVLCAEPVAPYQRPPLSKAYLLGTLDRDRLALRDASFYRQHDIRLEIGTGAQSIDRRDNVVVTTEAGLVPYAKLFMATGSRARTLDPPSRLAGVFCLRDLADADALRPAFGRARHVLVMGGGYVGLEVAAVAVGAGREVTLVEAADRVLARVAGPALSTFYADEHRRQGVDLRLATRVLALSGENGLETARLSDGSVVPCDLAIVGIGGVPNDEVAMYAGIEVEPGHGIVVDSRMRTSDPDIYAIGDCARAPNAYAGCAIRLESVANAVEQAKIAAADACGRPLPMPAVPWFWSDQYDLKLQTAGLALGGWDREVLRGDPATRQFSVFYLREGRIIALDAVNRAADFAFARRVVGTEAAEVGPDLLADERMDLKALLRPLRAA